jgi:hypothetical protein
MGHTENQLLAIDAWEAIIFGEEAVIGGVIEIKDISEVLIAVGDPLENACAAFNKSLVDKPVRVVTPHQTEQRKASNLCAWRRHFARGTRKTLLGH